MRKFLIKYNIITESRLIRRPHAKEPYIREQNQGDVKGGFLHA